MTKMCSTWNVQYGVQPEVFVKVQLEVFSLSQQPNAGQGSLILEVSISHTVTHHSR